MLRTHPENPPTMTRSGNLDWWRDAAIYQIYPRSFADANGDGVGDLSGITQRLGYVESLGVDAVWLCPFYVSPQADAGYDVADYRAVDPLFGTLADFDAMLAEAHRRSLRVIVDLVPNHTSSAHPWFTAALATASGSPERDRYIFRQGRGEAGELPPNNWTSVFGGPAWTPAGDGEWYLHLFDTRQPDLNWHNADVRAEFEAILRFWLDRGVDGFRVDVAHGLIKSDGLPDWAHSSGAIIDGGARGPMWDQDGVHEIYRQWRSVLREYGPDRVLVAEAWVAPAERLSRYVRADEMHQAFNFDFLTVGWNGERMRRSIDTSLRVNGAVGATTTWVLSNHDVMRAASRFGLADTISWPPAAGPDATPPDATLGLKRARAAAMLMFALPGSAYIYAGEELGLTEHLALPDSARQDPTFARTGGTEIGRDGCRVPLPWESAEPAYGFSPTGASWLPQPDEYAAIAADLQSGSAGSTLELFTDCLRVRSLFRLGRGSLVWNSRPASDILDFTIDTVRVVVNLGRHPVSLEDASHRLLSDPGAVSDGRLLPDSAIWQW